MKQTLQRLGDDGRSRPSAGKAGARAREEARAKELAALLWPGQSIALLQQLHILTREGQLNQDARRKLKQVYHLYRFMETLLQELEQAPAADALAPELSVADHGAGKSYLGFILFDLFFKSRAQGMVYGIESRADLVGKSRDLAAQLGFARMRFLNLTVAQSTRTPELPKCIDLVTALHACDSATDDAIAFGLSKQARAFALVPCCQAEAARHLGSNKALMLSRTPLAELWRHPLHTREMGSQITNVLRCLYLEANGYQVTVTELVGWEHSMKNELIIARYTGHRKRAAAERIVEIGAQFGLKALIDRRFTRQTHNSEDNADSH